jgi:hypothetical protein
MGATPGSVSMGIPDVQQAIRARETSTSGLLAFGSSAGLRPSPKIRSGVTGNFPVETSIPDYSGGTATDLHRVPG